MKKAMTISRALLRAALVAIIVCPTAFSSIEGYFESGLRVPVNYATFLAEDSTKIRLEVYYQVFNRMFRFEQDENGFLARFDVSIVVNDGDGHQVENYTRSRDFRVESMAEAGSIYDYRTSQANFDLDPGKYKVDIAVSDRNSDAVYRKELSLKLKDPIKGQPSLSDVEWVNRAVAVGEDTSSFDKANMTIIPAVDAVFGGDVDPRMIFYFELYRGTGPEDKIVLETTLRGKVAGMVYRDTIHVHLDQPILKQIKNISLDGFKAGSYELFLRLLGHRGKKIAEVSREFEVRWSQGALLKHDYEKALDQLSLIANPGEINRLKKLNTYEERVAGFNDFWRERDPARETPENEAKAEFYRRVSIANRVFSYIYREGWRTGRGRIYIQYGEPDQIDDYPLSHDARPYQLWHYYRDGRYRRFTFVDQNEDGDYRLIYPYDGLGLRPDF